MLRFVTLSAIVLGLLMQAGNASASAFRVTPIRVTLDRSSASALLTLTNESRDTLRFQISAFTWSQDEHGEMKLEPTSDILFFPALLTLNPGAERKVRVSSKIAAGDVEHSYRLFFEELPSLTVPGANQGTQVRILTKMGVPIFVVPSKQVEKAVITDAALQQGTLRFDLRNEGNVQFGVQSVIVRGLGTADENLFERQLEGWYVLAGDRRAYSLPIDAAICGSIKQLQIDVQTDSGVASAARASARIPVTAASCR